MLHARTGDQSPPQGRPGKCHPKQLVRDAGHQFRPYREEIWGCLTGFGRFKQTLKT